MRPRPLAVLDTNVLFPFQLRNLLLHLAVEDLYTPLWSAEILEELARVLGSHAGLTEGQRAHLLEQMGKYFPDALGSAPGDAADGLLLPDEGDRHVIALAAHYEADAIVTANLRHFPESALKGLGVEAWHPDEFCLHLAQGERTAVLRASEKHRTSLAKHPLTPEEYLASLSAHAGLRRTADWLEEAGFLSARARLRPTAGRTSR